MNNFTYSIPTKVHFGKGQIAHLDELKDSGNKVDLYAQAGKRSVTVEYPDMKYLGIWHTPGKDAPYVCLEPWSALPSRKGIVEDLETQPDMTALEGAGVYENTWHIVLE